MNTDRTRIILFDGVCNLCNSVVQWIILRDPTTKFHFATLQSDIGQTILRNHELDESAVDSVVLVEGTRAYTKSTAALRIARGLSSFWPVLYGFILIPRPIRDWAYDKVAEHRYKWFGRQETCMIPTPDLLKRFL